MTDGILSFLSNGNAPAPAGVAVAKPSDYSDLIANAEQRHGIPDGLLGRVINLGERSGAKAVSPKGAVGLGQLMPGTARDMGVTDSTDPAQNIEGSAKYLAQQLSAHNNDQRLAVAAYNAGPGAVKKYGGVPPYKETQEYVSRVTGSDTLNLSHSSDGILSFMGGEPPENAVASAGPFDEQVKQSAASAAASPIPATLRMANQTAADAPQSSASFMNMANATELNPSIAQENFLGSPAQQKAARQLDAAKKLDRSPTAMGTAAQPYFTTSQENNTSRLGPGVYYWDWDGALHQTPGAPISTGEGISAGVKQGYIKDAEASFGNMMAVPVKAFSDTFNDIVIRRNPFLSEEDKRAELSAPNEIDKALAGYKADRNAYDARYGNNGWATGGRLAGNVAFTAPLMGGAGAALEATPGMSFVAGTAGRGGNLLLRGSSLATRGALEGAGSSAILSSQTDKPLSEQLKQGALIGAALPVVGNALYGGGKAAVGGIRNALIDPITEAGQNKIVNRFLQERAAGAPVAIDAVSPIPGVQRTTAQSVVGGNSGLSALERSTKATNTEFSNQFDSLMKSNNEARKGYLSEVTGSKDDLAVMKQQADAAAIARRDAAFSSAKDANGRGVVQRIDSILEGPAGANGSVRGPLEKARANLVASEDGLIPAHRAELDKGIMKAMGSDAAKPTPDALQANKDRLGSIFEEAAGKTNIKAGDDFKSGLGQIVHDAGLVLSDSETAPLIKQVQGIIDTVDADGIIPGKAYQKIIAKDSPLDRLMKRPVIGEYGADIRNVLDDALQSSAKPEDVAALKVARSQYRNMKIAEGAINKAGPDQAVDPAHLLSAVKKNTGNYVYKGGGHLGDVAETAIKRSAARDVFESRPQALEEVYHQLDAAARKPGAHQAIAQARNAALDELDAAAPGYRQHVIDTQLERIPVAEKEYLHSLALDADEHLTLGKVNSALKTIEKLRNADGDNGAKALTKGTLNKIYALRDDLKAEGQSNAGRGAGSDTAQKLATAGMTKALGASKLASIPLALASGLGTMALGHNPMESTLVGGGSKMVLDAANSFYGAKNAEIHNKLISVLLDPEYANFAVNPVVNRRLIPAGANKLLSTVRSQGTMVGGITLNNRLRSAE